jgi:nitrogen fixation protein NifB
MKPPVPSASAALAAASEPAANCHLAPGVRAAVEAHPCYSEDAHHHFARIHVGVAPSCNIQCHYCNRKYDCAGEGRPGVVRERLTPEQAIDKVRAVARAMPRLSVVGIAGPGDALASAGATFRTCALVAREFPDLALCLSTNGLALPEHVGTIVALGVRHVTVTINMLDPHVGERIYPWIALGGRRIRGREASRILSERQLEGLERLAGRGVLCKVNSVLIPGVNDGHLPAVSQKVRALGAFVHNVVPLISAPEHGTHYGLRGQREPTAAELEAVRAACGGGVMRHCRQCRADAVGLLGQEGFAPEGAPASGPGPADAAAARSRQAHRGDVAGQRARRAEATARALREVAGAGALRIRVAVATRGEGKVNEHFGHAREFQVYDVSAAGVRLVAVRRVPAYCAGGEGEEDALAAVVRTLGDCAAVLASRIGRCPRERLRSAGIEPVQEHAFAFIEEAALACLRVRARAERRAGPQAPPAPAAVGGERSCGGCGGGAC